MLGDHGHGHLGGSGPALGGAHVARGQHPGDPKSQKWCGLFNRLLERRRLRAGQVAGVGTRRKGGDRDVDLLALLPGVEPFSGGLPGGVGVVGEHHPGGEVLEQPHVFVGQRGAAGGHRPG